MLARWIRPIESLKGSLTKEYYVRNASGKYIIQHKPRCTSEKQRKMREEFGKQYGGWNRKV